MWKMRPFYFRNEFRPDYEMNTVVDPEYRTGKRSRILSKRSDLAELTLRGETRDEIWAFIHAAKHTVTYSGDILQKTSTTRPRIRP